MLKALKITKSYKDIKVLKEVDMEVRAGELAVIAGPSGAGKSTLLHIISTLDAPDGGQLEIDGMNPFEMSAKKMAAFRNRHIGFVFQFHNLLPEFTALENVMIPGYIANENPTKLKERALRLFTKLDIAHRAKHYPAQLSGGEAQRVAVARALINSPKLIFADEPSGNLDSANAAALHQMFLQLRDEFGQTFIAVTHNAEFAEIADRKLLMKDGAFV